MPRPSSLIPVLFALACGEPPAVSGAHPSSAPQASPAVSSPPADKAPAKVSLDPAPAPAAATAAVLQLALDIPEMDGFWHTDVRPERVPLRIAPHPKLPVPLMVDKFGTRVVVEKDAPLQFDAIRIAGDEAHVAYRYEPEGVIAEVELASTGGRWRVVSSDVAER